MRSLASIIGLIALVAAIVIGALAALGVFGEMPVSFRTNPSAVEEAPTQTGPVSFSPGSVTAGGLSWTVTGVRRTAELRAYSLPPGTKRGDFLVVRFTVKNTSDLPVTLTAESMALVGEGSKEVPAAADNSQYVPPEKNLLFSEFGLLKPGEKKRGRVNFSLRRPLGGSEGISGLRLQLGDADPRASEEKYVRLSAGE